MPKDYTTPTVPATRAQERLCDWCAGPATIHDADGDWCTDVHQRLDRQSETRMWRRWAA